MLRKINKLIIYKIDSDDIEGFFHGFKSGDITPVAEFEGSSFTEKVKKLEFC